MRVAHPNEKDFMGPKYPYKAGFIQGSSWSHGAAMPDARALAGLPRRPCFDRAVLCRRPRRRGKITVVPNADPAIVARLSRLDGGILLQVSAVGSRNWVLHVRMRAN